MLTVYSLTRDHGYFVFAIADPVVILAPDPPQLLWSPAHRPQQIRLVNSGP